MFYTFASETSLLTGLHISAIGAFVYLALKKSGMKRSSACLFALLIISLYGVFVGFSVSVIRAVIMYSVRLFADIVKKVYDMLSATAFSAIVTIFLNPFSILDSAFVFSYATVIAIGVYITYIQKNPLRKDGVFRFLREAVRLPIVLALFNVPVTLRITYEYTLLSILVNSALAPFSGVILLLGALAMISSAVNITMLARLLDFSLHLMLSILDGMCNISSKAGLFTFRGQPSVVAVILYYVALIFYFAYVRKNEEWFVKAFYIANILLFLSSPIAFKPSVSMLYVGQGECIVFRTGPETAVMVDCGSSDKTGLSKYTIVPFLKAQGIKRIEALFVSHPDFDHCGEIPTLLDEAENSGIIINRVIFQDAAYVFKNEQIRKICSEAKRYGICLDTIEDGQKSQFGFFTFTCFWPSQSHITGDTNADSMVLLATSGNFDILLTGDITSETEDILIPKIRGKDIEVLKISHHGSSTATSEAFLAVASPDIAIISAGIKNRYGHPHEETLNRLQNAHIVKYTTRDCGEITIIPKFWHGDRSAMLACEPRTAFCAPGFHAGRLAWGHVYSTIPPKKNVRTTSYW